MLVSILYRGACKSYLITKLCRYVRYLTSYDNFIFCMNEVLLQVGIQQWICAYKDLSRRRVHGFCELYLEPSIILCYWYVKISFTAE